MTTEISVMYGSEKVNKHYGPKSWGCYANFVHKYKVDTLVNISEEKCLPNNIIYNSVYMDPRVRINSYPIDPSTWYPYGNCDY